MISCARDALLTMQQTAKNGGLAMRLHLWPGKSLGSIAMAQRQKIFKPT